MLLTRSRYFRIRREGTLLLLVFATGALVALLAVVMTGASTTLHEAIQRASDRALACDGRGTTTWQCGFTSFVSFVGARAVLIALAAMLVIWQPSAASSGMPHIKSHVNGTDVPGYLAMRPLVATVLGTICVSATGLPVGWYGPMMHIGAMVATQLVNLAARQCGERLGLRAPLKQREAISMGAAAGLAAAVQAPHGGVLYVCEELGMHWSRHATWRVFLCCTTVVATVRFFDGTLGCADDAADGRGIACRFFEQAVPGNHIGGGPAELSDRMRTDDVQWALLMAMAGGGLGAGFNLSVQALKRLCQRYVGSAKSTRVFVHALVLSTLMFTIAFWMPWAGDACKLCPGGVPCAGQANTSTAGAPRRERFRCAADQYDELATLLHATPASILGHLYGRDEAVHFTPSVLARYMLVYGAFAPAMLCAGFPSGALLPCMIIGAAGGRLLGEGLELADGRPGLFALIGSASMLGGVNRMPLTLALVMLEVAQDFEVLPALILALVVSSVVGDLVCPSLDDILMHENKLPYLPEAPPTKFWPLAARDVMSTRGAPRSCAARQRICTVNHAHAHAAHAHARASSLLLSPRCLTFATGSV